MTDKKDTKMPKLLDLMKWRGELETALIEADQEIAALSGKRLRSPEKPGRTRRARENASLASIRGSIAEAYGLPEDAIVFMEPGHTRQCKTITVGQLRTKWQWEPKTP